MLWMKYRGSHGKITGKCFICRENRNKNSPGKKKRRPLPLENTTQTRAGRRGECLVSEVNQPDYVASFTFTFRQSVSLSEVTVLSRAITRSVLCFKNTILSNVWASHKKMIDRKEIMNPDMKLSVWFREKGRLALPRMVYDDWDLAGGHILWRWEQQDLRMD